MNENNPMRGKKKPDLGSISCVLYVLKSEEASADVPSENLRIGSCIN